MAADQANPLGYKGRHWTVAQKAVKNGKSIALTVVEYRFDKAVAVSQGGCAPVPPVGINFGNILDCPISLPAAVPGGIVQLTYRCDPPDPKGACGHTVECPGGAICDPLHTGPTTPLNLAVDKPRSLDWWGWTDDGNHATLIFEAYVQ